MAKVIRYEAAGIGVVVCELDSLWGNVAGREFNFKTETGAGCECALSTRGQFSEKTFPQP